MSDLSMYNQEWFTRLATRLTQMSKAQLAAEKAHWSRQFFGQQARVADIVKARSEEGEQFLREESALMLAWENCLKLCQMVERVQK